jgi:uncharacterized membrane protein
MRGPDEPAHFIRAYGISQGQVIPSIIDDEGRKGVFIPLRLQREMEVFEFARHKIGDKDFTYHVAFADYARLHRTWANDNDAERQVFNLYGGSEGYSPVPYLPYLPAVAVARLAQLDFLSTLYLMRVTGFVVLTAILAYAIALVPRLQWTFVFIAFLPSALYGRSVVSADGAALAFAMVVAALCLKRVYSPATERRSTQAAWMTLCVMTKPPQIVFVILQATGQSLRDLTRQWRSLIIVVIPAVLVAVVWAVVGTSDVALWRIADRNELQQFDPIWRIGFMFEHPWHFIKLMCGTYELIGEYGLQLIGVLGWLDTPLQPMAYPVLGLLLLASFCVPLDLPPHIRLRIAALYATTVLAYCLTVFLIFYLVWTPLAADRVHGVQGRYFLVVLPLLAIMLSAQVNRGLSVAARGPITTLGATLSGIATVEAVLRFDWKLWS